MVPHLSCGRLSRPSRPELAVDADARAGNRTGFYVRGRARTLMYTCPSPPGLLLFGFFLCSTGALERADLPTAPDRFLGGARGIELLMGSRSTLTSRGAVLP